MYRSDLILVTDKEFHNRLKRAVIKCTDPAECYALFENNQAKLKFSVKVSSFFFKVTIFN